MNDSENVDKETQLSPLALTKTQRSHLLLVLSNAVSGREREFLTWYQQEHQSAMVHLDNILSVQYYERYDEAEEHYPPPKYRYLGLYELSLDGAEEAEAIIQQITESHHRKNIAEAPATWLYYPICEKVGRSATVSNPVLMVAYANGTLGEEMEFREWYCTRHIRHALNHPSNACGQCFELTRFQQPGSAEPIYRQIAIYEQEGTPKEALDFWYTLSPEEAKVFQQKFAFPTVDLTRCGEAYYQPVTERLTAVP